ncbi:dienelactone hydrolase family protein [Henriciella marina]|uniref:Dienelactone hydrolase family protein n=1 Tax=Henriciella marina TaxID=453851 RepID=A0ABT4LW03_9PROT|nr:dienelactone hydrolase family protein [Henriciella marina]
MRPGCSVALALLHLAACASRPSASLPPQDFAFEHFDAVGPAESVVVLAPGCGGVSERAHTQPMRPVARRLAASGQHVVIADYERAFRMRNTCNGGARLEEVAETIRLAAAQGLKQAGSSEALPVSLIGWSLGGSGVFLAGDRSGADRVVALYPDCSPFASLSQDIRYLVLIGEDDHLTPLSECDAIRATSEQYGARWVIYPGVYHGFDYKAFRGGQSVQASAFSEWFVAVEYNEDAAINAHDRIISFLDRAP